MSDKKTDISSMSYEAARDELLKVVAELEAGSVSLEASMELWERGEALADRCEQWLSGAREKLAKAKKSKESQ
ncbi:MAG: exodeoxyribonuclease VII small subunit [Actinomycetota bacterium]